MDTSSMAYFTDKVQKFDENEFDLGRKQDEVLIEENPAEHVTQEVKRRGNSRINS